MVTGTTILEHLTHVRNEVAMATREIYVHAHRGTIEETARTTLVAYRHAWRISGAMPEVDVRTTADGVEACLHDATVLPATTFHNCLGPALGEI